MKVGSRIRVKFDITDTPIKAGMIGTIRTIKKKEEFPITIKLDDGKEWCVRKPEIMVVQSL